MSDLPNEKSQIATFTHSVLNCPVCITPYHRVVDSRTELVYEDTPRLPCHALICSCKPCTCSVCHEFIADEVLECSCRALRAPAKCLICASATYTMMGDGSRRYLWAEDIEAEPFVNILCDYCDIPTCQLCDAKVNAMGDGCPCTQGTSASESVEDSLDSTEQSSVEVSENIPEIPYRGPKGLKASPEMLKKCLVGCGRLERYCQCTRSCLECREEYSIRDDECRCTSSESDPNGYPDPEPDCDICGASFYPGCTCHDCKKCGIDWDHGCGCSPCEKCDSHARYICNCVTGTNATSDEIPLMHQDTESEGESLGMESERSEESGSEDSMDSFVSHSERPLGGPVLDIVRQLADLDDALPSTPVRRLRRRRAPRTPYASRKRARTPVQQGFDADDENEYDSEASIETVRGKHIRFGSISDDESMGEEELTQHVIDTLTSPVIEPGLTTPVMEQSPLPVLGYPSVLDLTGVVDREVVDLTAPPKVTFNLE